MEKTIAELDRRYAESRERRVHLAVDALDGEQTACGNRIPNNNNMLDLFAVLHTRDIAFVTCSNCKRTRTYRGLETKLAKWQKETLDRLNAYGNRELLEATLEAAGWAYSEFADGNDEWTYQEAKKILYARLKSWLEEA